MMRVEEFMPAAEVGKVGALALIQQQPVAVHHREGMHHQVFHAQYFGRQHAAAHHFLAEIAAGHFAGGNRPADAEIRMALQKAHADIIGLPAPGMRLLLPVVLGHRGKALARAAHAAQVYVQIAIARCRARADRVLKGYHVGLAVIKIHDVGRSGKPHI